MQVLSLSRVQSVSGASGGVQGLFSNLNRSERTTLSLILDQYSYQTSGSGRQEWMNTYFEAYTAFIAN